MTPAMSDRNTDARNCFDFVQKTKELTAKQAGTYALTFN